MRIDESLSQGPRSRAPRSPADRVIVAVPWSLSTRCRSLGVRLRRSLCRLAAAHSLFQFSAIVKACDQFPVRRLELPSLCLIGRDAFLKLLDCFILHCETARVIDCAVSVVPILALESQNLVLHARVLRSQRMGDLPALVHFRLRYDRAAARDDRRQKRDRS
jgi:hypothetical protein